MGLALGVVALGRGGLVVLGLGCILGLGNGGGLDRLGHRRRFHHRGRGGNSLDHGGSVSALTLPKVEREGGKGGVALAATNTGHDDADNDKDGTGYAKDNGQDDTDGEGLDDGAPIGAGAD